MLLRSFPVLIALLLALFAPAAPAPGPRGAAPGPVTASFVAAGRDERTTASSPAETTAEAVTEPRTAAQAVADRAPALTAQRTAGVAGSRAPPHTV
ncbi:hypothetical protein MB27_01515 [Actinoplanes utahensis]|uniref:Uncharacterized protein n=1 Tax=Actinoplanes utahensis TaxID=1869 RepID=A0A0A6UTZ0_ACTUT|nr:hypothetical protein MB27_01515 [Actinoplanes utahensis]